MATRAAYLGAAGVVIDGRFRDIKEIQDLGLPARTKYPIFDLKLTNEQLFARQNSILGSNTFTRASELNIPLQVKADLWISPGDFLVGDQDGVVVVPPSLVDQVVQLCQERNEIDDKTMKALKAGEKIGHAIKMFREQ